jgi:hypothetical protein
MRRSRGSGRRSSRPGGRSTGPERDKVGQPRGAKRAQRGHHEDRFQQLFAVLGLQRLELRSQRGDRNRAQSPDLLVVTGT